MTNLIVPKDGPRVAPLGRHRVNAYVRAEYDKSIHTWGIPNNLIRTMSCLPALGLTEVDYANSFIFDEGEYIQWPDPENPERMILFPRSGFVDRVTKELCINLVSLMNRSRYSITHHTVIGWNTLTSTISEPQSEQMLLHLVDDDGTPAFAHRNDLFNSYQLCALELSEKLQKSAHSITNTEFDKLRVLCTEQAKLQIDHSVILKSIPESKTDAYLKAYVDAMLVELTWCIVHFSGLLNNWFTVMKVMDETDPDRDGLNFVAIYNEIVPESIKIRNNKILGSEGWG